LSPKVIPGDEQLHIQESPGGTGQVEVPDGGVQIEEVRVVLFPRIWLVVGTVSSIWINECNGGRGEVR